jgi:hypothetical protein
VLFVGAPALSFDGQEDIFPDPFAVDFGRQFGSSPKASERQMTAMAAAMLSGSAA